MFQSKNMGSKESRAQVIGGALLVACSLTQRLHPELRLELVQAEQVGLTDVDPRVLAEVVGVKARFVGGRAKQQQIVRDVDG